MSPVFFLRLFGMVVLAVVGYQVAESLVNPPLTQREYSTIVSMALAGAALGLLVTPYLTVVPFNWLRHQIQQLPANTLFTATVGLVIGLIISVLLAVPLSMLPGELGRWLPLAMAALCCYVGVSIMVMRQADMVQAVGGFVNVGGGRGSFATAQLIVDTSAIIDGRIADISQTGFIQGTLVVPRFVLDELRHIADSSDSLRRNRGRRGLEMLNKLRKDATVPITISDIDFEDTIEVDAKLIKLARALRGPIITNDYNLNRAAEVQGVRALNINELANAVKSVVLPGEELLVRVIQEGKEAGQGVGFLEDGTMVVVEAGRRHLGQLVGVVVNRVLQTVAGRMIFAQQKPD